MRFKKLTPENRRKVNALVLNKQKAEYIRKRGMSVEILSLKNRIKSSIFPFENDKVIYFHYYPQKTA